MDILAGSRDQTFSSQLLGRVYFNCKCVMRTYDFNNAIQTLIMLYILSFIHNSDIQKSILTALLSC